MKKDLIDSLQAYESELIDRYNAFKEDADDAEVSEVLEKLCIVQMRLMAAVAWQKQAGLLSGG